MSNDQVVAGTTEQMAVVREGLVTVTRMYSKGKILKSEESTTERIQVLPMTPGVPAGCVSFGYGMTVNMGNYESGKVECRVELPCYLHEIEECFHAAHDFVNERIDVLVTDLHAMRDANTNDSGKI